MWHQFMLRTNHTAVTAVINGDIECAEFCTRLVLRIVTAYSLFKYDMLYESSHASEFECYWLLIYDTV
jgi:hypothetical protein